MQFPMNKSSFFTNQVPWDSLQLQPQLTPAGSSHHPSIDQWAHPQSILLNNQNAAYPTPRPSGNMIHGRHRDVSLNFQAKIPTARMPNIVPMILGSIVFYSHLRFFINEVGYSTQTLPCPLLQRQLNTNNNGVRP